MVFGIDVEEHAKPFPDLGNVCHQRSMRSQIICALVVSLHGKLDLSEHAGSALWTNKAS